MISGRPTKPKPPRIPIWVTEKELRMIESQFPNFRGGLAEALALARIEANKAKTQHNRNLREYRNARREDSERQAS